MGQQNALEFLRVDFVYLTCFIPCDLSRHAIFKEVLLYRGSFYLLYSQTPLQSGNPLSHGRHLIVTDSLLCPWGKKALSFSTRLVRRPSEYRHILSTAPSVSGFTGFYCIISGAESIAYY